MDYRPTDWRAAQTDSSALDVFLLGCVDFDAWLMLQDRLAAEVQSRRDRYGILLLCEHPPLISLGRDGSAADLPWNGIDEDASPVPIRWVGRGGGAWRHGPGQLSIAVLAPIDRLELTHLAFRRALIRSVLQTARDCRVAAKSSSDIPGVTGRVGQFAFIGAAVHSGSSRFGMVLNVAPSREITDFSPGAIRSSSLSAERLRPLAMAGVRESMARHLAAELGYDEFHIHTGHPWLRRTTRTVPIHA